MEGIPEWYFGPPGDLRPLPSPDTDVANTVERFGGIHTALTGGRTVDTLGYRASYEFSLSHLEQEDYFWLEALHTQTIPGPFKLVDPLRKNLLSRDAALGKPADASRKGLTPTGYSTLRWIRATDSPVTWSQRIAEWAGLELGGAASLVMDSGTPAPVRVGQPVTVSAYVRPSAAFSVFWGLTPQDATGSSLSGSQSQLEVLTPGAWTPISYTYVPESPAVSLYPVLSYVRGSGATSQDHLDISTPQLEYGQSPTSPAIGGGSVTVGIESLETTSPRFPLQSVTLSLLEV